MRWTVKKVLKKAEFVISNSQSLLNCAEVFNTDLYGKSVVIRNGVDLHEFQKLIKKGREDPYIFAIGRFVHKKGFDILLHAFQLVATRYPDIKLIIAGDGEERGNLEILTQQLGLKEKVRFIGIIDRSRVVQFFNNCEFFVLPSRIEPLGIVNLEAMAARKAIAAMKVNGVHEIIKDGENGILVKSLDSKSLAKAMTYMLENPGMRKKMGENGRKLVEEKYTWDKIVSKYLKIYGEILQKTNN